MAALHPADRQTIRLIVVRMALQSPRATSRRIQIADIIDQVDYEMGVRRVDLLGADRSASLFRARAAVCWLARELTPASLPQIGAILGGRDHSSILHACRRAADMRDRDPAFRRLTNRLVRHFRDLQED